MSSKKTSENSWLGNIPLTGKVSLLVGSLLTLFIVSSIGTSLVLEQEKQNRAAFRDTVNLLREVEQTNRVLYQRQSELRQLLLSPGEPDTTTLDSANTAISQHLEHLGQQVRDDAAQSTRLDGIRSLDTAWRNTVETLVLAELRRLAKAAPAEATAQRERLLPQFTARAPVATPAIVAGLDNFGAYARQQLEEREQALQQSESQREWLLWGTLLLAALCGVAALRLSATLVTHPLRLMSGLMERLARHDHAIETPQLDRRDEIGTISRALAEFKQMAIDISDQNWVSHCVGAITDRLQRASSHAEFAQALLSQLGPELGAGVALFHLRADDDLLHPVGHYGYQPDPAAPVQPFKMGESLVGQCAVEARTIELGPLPGHYLRMRSGLGEAVPPRLMLIPVLSMERVLAVIELGLTGPLDARRHRLLEALLPVVALSLENITRAVHTRELLEHTQSQAAELRTSEEELRTQQEELQASNEELRQQSEILNQQKTLLETLQRETADKAEALARASQYKSDFLANMSHELRTPLNSLLILSNDLAENREGNLSDDQVESARIIHEGGTNLLRLINDILDLSKIEAGKMELALEQVDLRGFAARLKRQFDHVARGKSLRFAVEIGDTLPPAVRADGGKLEQIVTNLLGNAFKFTQSGEVRLVLRRPTADLPGFPAAGSVAIEVRDTGIGIPPEKFAQVFGAFEQLDAGTSRQFGGTGLGLAISRQLARLHHGDIQLRSEPGQGSVFTLLLPQVQPGTAESPPPDETAPIASGTTTILPDAPPADPASPRDTTILVIEDDPAFARVLADMIRRKGCTALVAHSGEAGILLARQHHPTGVILDLMLPDIDGWTVLERLKAEPGLRHVPVHIVSALDEPARTRDSGAAGYLTKPVSADALNGAIDRLMLPTEGQARRLLIVDDDPASRASVRTLLSSQPVDISEAGSAEEALSILRGETFDCVVLDLGLPGISGFDFLERLAAVEPRPPVVVYSARELSREDQLRIRSHTDSVVIKGTHSSERLLDEVSLFLHSVRLRPTAPASGGNDDLKGRKVLMVDDDMRNLFALSKALRSRGMEVLMAQDGSKALRQLEENPDIELVLMDVMMPVMDGYEATQEIRKNPRHAHLPIISLTAKAMQGDREKSLASGANDYMPKPVDIPKLLSMMRVWLHR
ncbi:MAG: response regulator [Alcaligenaceae bacterium]|nr:response regulator [Alcaligenaceae bacterium SAGV5]MPS55069.1 response regulator [Alcaligenaceae bacterium SAGV3]MPT58069.1 response regulator [Alcaligenaceae bacterium]